MTDEVTPDGSPVEVYRRLPPGDAEADLIHAAVPERAEILELGCGAGRVTLALVARGHPVVAVDQSAAMLAGIEGVPGVATVEADIEALDLGRRLPVVLLGSHLVNSPEAARSAFLETARRHVTIDGVVLIETYDPDYDWSAAVGRTSAIGDVRISLERADRRGDQVDAVVAYEVDGRVWRQPFRATLFDEAGLADELARHGLRFERWLDRGRGWLLATADRRP